MGTRSETKGFQYLRSTVCFTALEWGFALGKCGLVSIKAIVSDPSAVMILAGKGCDPAYAGLFK